MKNLLDRTYTFFLLIIFIRLISTNTFQMKSIARIQQEILLGPQSIHTYPGRTVHFPCVVNKQSDAIVTWCWNDFCTLGKAQLIQHQTTNDGLINVYQYAAYPRFHLLINERLHHYNLSISHVSNDDEGVFQCQIQRTKQANEARSERVQLIILDPPDGTPRLTFPRLPLHQGRSVNITCLSSSSKPASNLILYKNEKILTDRLTIIYELDAETKKNQTKIIYTIDDPDVSWDEANIRCEQIYQWIPHRQKDVKEKLRVLYKPKVRIESQNRASFIVNSTATFRCIVQANPPGDYRWFANSIDLPLITSSILKIPLSKHVHNHSIGCTARNSLGLTTTTFRLLIRYPPIFLIRPPKIFILDFNSRSSKIIRCLVDSYPPSTIRWYRHGLMIHQGGIFNLENITKREDQGIYSYRIETDGFQTMEYDLIIYIKGKPLIFLEESSDDRRIFHCQIYSATPITKILWQLNDQILVPNNEISILNQCDSSGCQSKLIYDIRKLIFSSKIFNHLSCLAENDYGLEQSRLYHLRASSDASMILIWIILSTLILIIFASILAIYCCCRARMLDENVKNLPIVFDEHYSLNELIKEVGSFQACHTSCNPTGQLSTQIESTDHLLTRLFNNNTKKFLDHLSNQSSRYSSGFHSKSTTTSFHQDENRRENETMNLTYAGTSPLYINREAMKKQTMID